MSLFLVLLTTKKSPQPQLDSCVLDVYKYWWDLLSAFPHTGDAPYSLNIFVALHWALPTRSLYFLELRSPELDTVLQMWPHQGRAEGEVNLQEEFSRTQSSWNNRRRMDIPVHLIPSEIFTSSCIYSVWRPDFSEFRVYSSAQEHVRSISLLVGKHVASLKNIQRYNADGWEWDAEAAGFVDLKAACS